VKIRLGIVGAGIASRDLHLPALKRLEDLFEITAINSRTEKKALAFAALLDNPPRVFESYAEMLSSSTIDAVVLAVPIVLNPEMILTAAKAGIPVICEKPVAPTLNAALELKGLKTNPVVYIAENYRHIKVFRKAAEIIRSGRIGRPVAFLWQKRVNFNKDNKYVQTRWRQKPEHIGGFISDGGVHDIAVLRLILGEVFEVNCFAVQNFDYLGDIDTITLNLKLENGTVGNYSVLYGSPVARNQLEVVGTDGAVSISKEMSTIDITGRDPEHMIVDISEGFEEEFRDFHAVLKGQENRFGSVQEAIRDLAVIEAGLISARESRNIIIADLLDGAKKE
jgi:predicted dehydrogenase